MVKNRIREVRKMRGFSQQQLADEINRRRNVELSKKQKTSKVRHSDISMIERGQRGFSSRMMELMAEVLEVEIGDLFFTSRVSCNDTKDK